MTIIVYMTAPEIVAPFLKIRPKLRLLRLLEIPNNFVGSWNC